MTAWQGKAAVVQRREEGAAQRRGEGERRRREERRDKGLTLNLLSFSLGVSLIYIRGVTITNGPGPIA